MSNLTSAPHGTDDPSVGVGPEPLVPGARVILNPAAREPYTGRLIRSIVGIVGVYWEIRHYDGSLSVMPAHLLMVDPSPARLPLSFRRYVHRHGPGGKFGTVAAALVSRDTMQDVARVLAWDAPKGSSVKVVTRTGDDVSLSPVIRVECPGHPAKYVQRGAVVMVDLDESLGKPKVGYVPADYFLAAWREARWEPEGRCWL